MINSFRFYTAVQEREKHVNVLDSITKKLFVKRSLRESRFFYRLVLCAILFLIDDDTLAQSANDLIEKVTIGQSQVRYYLHYDLYGNSPEGFSPDKINASIHAGDEIVVRFYPNAIFDLGQLEQQVGIPHADSIGNKNGFIIFPLDRPDTFSVSPGIAAIYFATKENGKFNVRIAEKASEIEIDSSVPIAKLKNQLRKQSSRKLAKLSKLFSEKRFNEDWGLWTFEELFLETGHYTVEIFQVTPSTARLLYRIENLHVTEVFQNMVLLHRTELSASVRLPMEKRSEFGYFEAVLTADQTIAGVHHINIMYDYSAKSWQFRQAPSVADGTKLKFSADRIVIGKEHELPSSVRARAGFAVFDEASEARLISNFVFVLYPQDYFSKSTGFFKRLNPTMGLQIGGTGTQDLVFLLGGSFKIVNEGDFVFGVRFGRETETESWVGRKNFYFGASLDPGLFGKLRNTNNRQ